MKLPAWLSRAKQTRPGVAAVSARSFAAAETNRLIQKWRWDGGFTAQELSGSLAVIRARSREMQKNSPHYKRWIQACATNIVGTGFAFKSTPQDGAPGQFRLDTQAAKFIEFHYWRWVNTPEFYSYSRNRTAAMTDRLCVKTWKRDGEYFKVIEPNAQNPYGIAVRLVRPDACDETYNIDQLPNGNMVVCGVELDKETHAPVAYYFHTLPPFASVFGRRGALYRMPATRVIHGFTQEDEDQTRGVPAGHAALVKLWMIDQYDEAEITAARDEACSVRTYYVPKGQEDAIIDILNPDTPGGSQTVAALLQEKSPGQSEVLPVGYDSKVNTPQHPNREVTAFKASMLKDVASGFGVEYANFANDWAGVSFSSVRQGTISERDAYIVEQDQMIGMDKSPEFRAWLRSFLSLAISGGYPVEKFDKFASHSFRGRRWMWVDPMRDMAAALIAKQNGWKTDTQIAAEMDQDFDDNIEEIKREALAKKGTRLEGGPDPAAARAFIEAAHKDRDNEDEK